MLWVWAAWAHNWALFMVLCVQRLWCCSIVCVLLRHVCRTLAWQKLLAARQRVVIRISCRCCRMCSARLPTLKQSMRRVLFHSHRHVTIHAQQVDVAAELRGEDGCWRSHTARLSVPVRPPFRVSARVRRCRWAGSVMLAQGFVGDVGQDLAEP